MKAKENSKDLGSMKDHLIKVKFVMEVFPTIFHNSKEFYFCLINYNFF